MEGQGKVDNYLKDQRGFTLVELLIGMVILSIVTAAVCSFIVIGSKSYAAANTEIMLQQEAQLALNQISDVIIDTTSSVNYGGATIAEDGNIDNIVLVEKDADFTFEPSIKILTMYNGTTVTKLDENGNPIREEDEEGNPKVDADGNPVYKTEIDSGNGNQKHYQFLWDRTNATLYYKESSEGAKPDDAFEGAEQVTLAEYVTEFSIDLSQVEEKRVVQISMTFEKENKSYHTSNNITIRNKVRINDMELTELDRKVLFSVKAKESEVILEPGEEYTFSIPLVSGSNVIDKSVKWDFYREGGKNYPADIQKKYADYRAKYANGQLMPSSSNLTAAGTITIGVDETAEAFPVVVETNATMQPGNEPAYDLVIVRIKRATDVKLYKSADENADNGANEVSAGQTFSISAVVEGTESLGKSCGGCADGVPSLIAGNAEIISVSSIYDKTVISKDDPIPGYAEGSDIYTQSWEVVKGADIVTLESSTNKTAVFRVSANAQVGDEIVIRATSSLSARKVYPNVSGEITLKVAKHNVDLHWSGDFKYGDEPLTLSWDYSSHYSLICVRIKTDDPNAPTADDKVMIYDSDGKAIRVGADLFGLNLDHNYYISIQVLDYALDKNAWDYTARRDEIVAEYNGHLDSTGTYIGEIPSSSKVTVPLLRPQFTVSYNGKNYVGEQVDIQTISALSPSYVSCPLVAISSTRSEGERVLNDSKCNVYTGKGTDISGWTPLWTYQENNGSYTGTGSVGGLSFGNCSVHNVLQLCIKIDTNNNGAINAVGSYHYVPFFQYSNATDAQRYNVHWYNYEPDYGMHYYYRPESAINFEIVGKGNLDLWAYTTSTNFVKGEIYFPLPSESKFSEYFALQNTSRQETSQWNWFQMLGVDGGSYGVEFSKMACQYYAIDDVYEIELFYRFRNPVWELDVEKSAGRFRCAANGTEWSRLDKGSLDDQFIATGQNLIPLYNGPLQIDGSNASFVMRDNNGNQQNVKAYIPLPTDAAFSGHDYKQFGFKLQQDGAQTAAGNGIGFKYQKIGNTGTDWRNCDQIVCTYDKNTDTYTLALTTILSWKWDGSQNVPEEVDTIKLTCKSTDTKWMVVK